MSTSYGKETNGDDLEVIEVFEQKGQAVDDGQDPDYGDDVSDDPPTPVKYTIVSKADVRRDLDNKIEIICTTFLLSRPEAKMLLHHFKWSVQRTQEEWLEREQKVREAIGLFERTVIETFSDDEKSACGICHENNLRNTMIGISCGHWFCQSCLTGYVNEAITKSSKCLALICPCSSCNTFVGLGMVDFLSIEENKKKMDNYFLESYLISCKEAKLCPSSGCEYVVFSSGGEVTNDSSVTCRCLYRFCWNCSKEAHSPVDCCIADKWISIQLENWIVANTKPCPSCRSTLETDWCYKYSKCPNCNYEFCWDCGDNWYGNDEDPDASNLPDTRRDTHSEKTMFSWEHNHQCRLNESSRPVEFRFDAENRRELARKSWEKYSLCYEKWVTIESCRKNALTDLKLFQEVQLVEICEVLNLSFNEMDFLVEAHLQIVEGWQVLKWSYVYGYFVSEDEIAKMTLLEFSQEEAEDLVRQLNKQVEKWRMLLYEYIPFKRFIDLRVNLVELTRVTKTHLIKMEAALMAGFPEIESSPR